MKADCRVLNRSHASASRIPFFTLCFVYSCGLMLAAPQPVSAAEDYATWTHYVDIAVDTRALSLGADVQNFPLLVRLDPSEFSDFDQVNDDGSDIRFAKTDDTPLPYEIERWKHIDVSNDTAEIWVLVDQVAANAVTTIRMYYGNAGAADSSCGECVFDINNGFVAVWHLADDYANAASGGHDGTNNGMSNGPGAVGAGAVSDAQADNISVPHDAALNGFTNCTISAWAYPSSYTFPNARMLSKNSDYQLYFKEDNSDRPTFTINSNDVSASTAVATGQWHHIAGVYEPGNATASQRKSIFVNGAFDGGEDASGSVGASGDALLINGYPGFDRGLDGSLDEIRIENVARGGDWIELCYATQAPGAVIVDPGTPVCVAPIFNSHPSDQTVAENEQASFSVSVTEVGAVAYQWQHDASGSFANIAGETAATLAFAASLNDDGVQYRCVVTDQCNTSTSNAATLTVTSACVSPTIDQNPDNASVNADSSATFSVSASGTEALAYQWQRGSDGTTWSDISGAAASSYSFTASAGDDGDQFRCEVTNSCGVAYSSAATLSVCIQPSIDSHPSDTDVTVGEVATYSVSASGTAPLSYQWQSSQDGSGWVDIGGATQSSYEHSAVTGDDGMSFRCRISGCGETTVSTEALLTVCSPASIGADPDDASVNADSSATFSVSASGTEALAYQWQRSSDGTTWSNISGAAASSYSFTASAGDHGDQFRCEVTNSCGVAVSDAATLSVCIQPLIDAQPSDADVTVGEVATYSVSASGTAPLSYQWQSTQDGSGWVDIGGATQSSYEHSAVAGDDGMSFRCRISGCGETTVSTEALLTVCSPATIGADPEGVEVTAGSSATFSVAASGSATLVYQWQRSDNGGASWTDIAAAANSDYSLTAAGDDDGAWFRCEVSNACDTARSVAAALSVCVPAAVDQQPADIQVVEGQSAAFNAAVNGDSTVSLQWQRYDATAWSDIADATDDTLALGSVAISQNGYRYRVIARNACGVDTSREATLQVSEFCEGATIAEEPTDAGVSPGQTASFTIAASGTSPVTFQWQLLTQSWTDLASANEATLTISSPSLSDNGKRYRCIAANGCGRDTSVSATLSVGCDPIAIVNQPRPDTVDEQQNAYFSVSATGTALVYQWQRSSDGVAWSDISGAVAADVTLGASLEDDGVRLRCVILDGCGTDTVTAAARLAVNNVRAPTPATALAASATGPSSIAAQWQTPESGDTDADSVWLLISLNGYPQFDDSLAQRRGFALRRTADVRRQEFTDRIADTTYWLTLWIVDVAKNRVAADSARVVTPAYGAVYNPLTLSGQKLDSARVSVSVEGFGDLPSDPSAAHVDSIGLWIQAAAYPRDSVRATAPDTAINIATAQSPGDPFEISLSVAPDSFAYVAASPFWKQTASGDSIPPFTEASRVRILLIDTAGVRPPNHIALEAVAGSPTEIGLSWAPADSVRIWYATQRIDAGVDLSGAGLLAVKPDRNAQSVTVGSLDPQTTYWFGLERYSDGRWSLVSESSRDSATTLTLDTTKLVDNRLHIDSLAYDTVSNRIVAYVRLDTANSFWHDDLEAGLQFRIGQAPAADTGLQVVALNGIDTAAALDRAAMQFDAVYYVAARLRRRGSGVWSARTDEASATIRTPAFTWQKVTYWPEGDSAVTAANNTISIAKGPRSAQSGRNEDSLVAYALPVNADGFVEAGTGFAFTRKLPVAPFYIGMRIDPAYADLADQARIYRDSAGVMLLEHESYVENGVAMLLTNDLDLPFLALVDTVRPAVAIDTTTDTAAVAAIGQAIPTRFSVDDNIGNAAARFQFGFGNAGYDDSLVFTIGDTGSRLAVVPSSKVNPSYGVRARMIVNDGAHADTIDLSRQVAIESADEVPVVDEKVWTPIRATAELLDASIYAVLDGMLDKDEQDAGYDNTLMRLFRWHAYRDNTNRDSKWVEFAPTVDTLFRFTPGRVFWIKTLERATIRTGAGVSTSLKKPAEIRLRAGQWTDFAPPFKFDIMLGDILDATGPSADSLQFYHWERRDSLYVASPVYMRGIEAVDSARNTAIISYGIQQDAYTVFNGGANDITLKVPPTPRALSAYPASTTLPKKRDRDAGWTVAIASTSSRDGDLGVSYCGVSSSGNKLFPRPPSFARSGVGLFDTLSGRMHGHSALAEIDEGALFPLVFYNHGDVADTIRSAIASDASPETFEARMFAPQSLGEQAAQSCEVVLEPGERQVCWLAVGSSAYLKTCEQFGQRQHLQLESLTAEPATRRIRLVFRAPLDGQSVALRLFDVRGRTLWQTIIPPAFLPGAQSAVVPVRPAPGVYVIQISAMKRGVITKSAVQSLIVAH